MMQHFFKATAFVVTFVRYLVAPPICFACKEFMTQKSILCHDCDRFLIPVGPKLVRINNDYHLTIHAICKYDGPIKNMIIAKHYSDDIAFEALGDLIWQKTVLSHLNIDCFVPVPLHWSRKIKRGFNQADILAERLSKYSSVPIYNMIVRIQQTRYQSQLQKDERKENVAHAFAIKNGFNITGKHVMLVDDLCTTASTAVSIAKLLIRYKPASIGLVVACRAL